MVKSVSQLSLIFFWATTIVIGVSIASVQSVQAKSKSSAVTNTKLSSKLGEEFGIQVLSVRRTSANYMLDFRYKMLDPKKAAAIMNRKIKPVLIVEKSGHKFYVPIPPKIGPLRQSPKFSKVDKNYFMFFANPGKNVKAGDKVTIEIGDFRAEHIVVE